MIELLVGVALTWLLFLTLVISCIARKLADKVLLTRPQADTMSNLLVKLSDNQQQTAAVSGKLLEETIDNKNRIEKIEEIVRGWGRAGEETLN